MHEIGAVMFNVVPSIIFLDFLLATVATDTGEYNHSLAEVKFPLSSSLRDAHPSKAGELDDAATTTKQHTMQQLVVDIQFGKHT